MPAHRNFHRNSLTLRTDEHYIADLDRLYRVEAINTLLELMRGGKDERVRGIGGSGAPRPRLGQGEGEVVTGAESSYFDVLRAVNESMLSKRNETQT